MDPATLFDLIRDLSDKLGILGQDLATVTATVSWLDWWTKLLITGAAGNMLIGSINTILLYRNGRHNAKGSNRED